MSEIEDFVVTEGRAYHAGDVVILRARRSLTGDEQERARAILNDITQNTGVSFVLLMQEMEVVEPS